MNCRFFLSIARPACRLLGQNSTGSLFESSSPASMERSWGSSARGGRGSDGGGGIASLILAVPLVAPPSAAAASASPLCMDNGASAASEEDGGAMCSTSCVRSSTPVPFPHEAGRRRTQRAFYWCGIGCGCCAIDLPAGEVELGGKAAEERTPLSEGQPVPGRPGGEGPGGGGGRDGQ